MQLIFFGDWGTLFLDISVWVFFHLSLGFTFSRLPLRLFNPDYFWFQTMSWEKSGEINNTLFKVKKWKDFVPSGSSLYKNAYEVKHIAEVSSSELLHWIKESCRSEVCHWVIMLPGPLFFIWNNIVTGWLMVAYAIANNLVPIIMQRYNRPRIRKFMAFVAVKERKAATLEDQTTI